MVEKQLLLVSLRVFLYFAVSHVMILFMFSRKIVPYPGEFVKVIKENICHLPYLPRKLSFFALKSELQI